MANIVIIENDPRVLRQMQQYLKELGGEENKIRTFESEEAFSARYFNAANKTSEPSPLQKLDLLKDWTSIQIDWLLDKKLETEKPFDAALLNFQIATNNLVLSDIDPAIEDGQFVFGKPASDFINKPKPLYRYVGTPFQPIYADMLKKAVVGEKNVTKTLPIASADLNLFWLVQVTISKVENSLILQMKDVTNEIRSTHTEEVQKKATADEEGVELDLLASIDLIIVKLTMIKNLNQNWFIEKLKKIEEFGFRPQLRPTKFVVMKYEDDGIHKVDLLHPQINDLIYLPLDRALFLQKIDIVLSQPEIVKPRFLFQQDTEMEIMLSKRTMVENISDVGFAIRNPIALKQGLLGHFFLSFPGEDEEFEIFGKVQKSEVHPEIAKQYLVYFSYCALDKEILTKIRRFLSKNPRYQNLKSEDKDEFAFNPDNIFLTEEDRRIKNIVLVSPDTHLLSQTSKQIMENMEQVRVVGISSYQTFLKNNFSKGDPKQKVDLASVKPTADSDFGKMGKVMFFIKKESLEIEAPMAPEDDAEKILGHAAPTLLAHNKSWLSLLFPLKDEQDILEEAVEAAFKGRKISKTFIVHDHTMEPRLVTISIERSQLNSSIKVELSAADAKTLKQKILLEAPVDTLDILLIDSHFIPEDMDAWIEGLTHLAKQQNMLPGDNQLKVVVIGSDDQQIDVQKYTQFNFRQMLVSPFETRTLLSCISLNIQNSFSIYNYENLGWVNTRMPVHLAKPVTLLSISEFGATIASNAQIARGTYLFLRGSIFDQAPRRNLCGRFYAAEESDEGGHKYKCHLLYYGINESFMKYARSWFRETYAASKQDNG